MSIVDRTGLVSGASSSSVSSEHEKKEDFAQKANEVFDGILAASSGRPKKTVFYYPMPLSIMPANTKDICLNTTNSGGFNVPDGSFRKDKKGKKHQGGQNRKKEIMNEVNNLRYPESQKRGLPDILGQDGKTEAKSLFGRYVSTVQKVPPRPQEHIELMGKLFDQFKLGISSDRKEYIFLETIEDSPEWMEILNKVFEQDGPFNDDGELKWRAYEYSRMALTDALKQKTKIS